jgi:hypothetical protein
MLVALISDSCMTVLIVEAAADQLTGINSMLSR